jgi:hypothetical protein
MCWMDSGSVFMVGSVVLATRVRPLNVGFSLCRPDEHRIGPRETPSGSPCGAICSGSLYVFVRGSFTWSTSQPRPGRRNSAYRHRKQQRRGDGSVQRCWRPASEPLPGYGERRPQPAGTMVLEPARPL